MELAARHDDGTQRIIYGHGQHVLKFKFRLIVFWILSTRVVAEPQWSHSIKQNSRWMVSVIPVEVSF